MTKAPIPHPYPVIPARKCIALIAHDGRKEQMIRWVKKQRSLLSRHRLVSTGTTGSLVTKATGLRIRRFLSGPLGGDQQIGAELAKGKVHMVIFFWDPLTAQPHDPDVKALLRLAALYEVPVACDPTTADFLVSSPSMGRRYARDLTISRR